jgi:glutathione synthase/RimK-type ligase-like ATP-grasp enzyme
MVSNNKPSATVELLFKGASDMGLKPEWITPHGLFVISTADREHYINHERSYLNSHTSVSLAKNKYFTRLLLDRHGLPNIPYLHTGSRAEAMEFLREYGVIIAKPVRGSGSVDIHIIRQAIQLTDLFVKDYILEQYLPGKELRYLVLENKVIAVHESRYGESVAADRKLERISYESVEWSPLLVDMSTKIAKIFGLSFAGVDFLVGTDGQPRILEVNSRPGFKWFHGPTAGPPVDVATLFLQSMLGAATVQDDRI